VIRLSWKRLAPIGAVLAPMALSPAVWLALQRRPPAAPRAAAALPSRRLPEPVPPSERLSERVEQVVLAQKKRIMGRKKSLIFVSRVASEIGPLVARALEQPAIQGDLQALAADMGLTLPAYKEYFRRKQEADLLLESGGDPNARSVANAIGAAQWLASTGRGQGLRVDLAASRRLTAKVDSLQADLEALQEQPPEFTRPAPPGWAETGRRGDLSPRRHGGHGEKHTERAGVAQDLPAPGPLTHPEHPPVAQQTTSAAGTSPSSARSSPPTTAATPPSAPVAPSTPAAQGTAASPAENTPGPDAPPVPPAPSPFATPPATSPSRPVAPVPAGTVRGPHRRPVASAPAWPRDRWIGYRKWELTQLLAKRRRVDERYDPAKAIAAQTRYLVRLTYRYGRVDWALQAYHGGEGGVSNTVSRYLGERRRLFTCTEGAIRGTLASRGGAVTRARPLLTYTDLYFGATPRSHPDAFGYLYGRSDDHRYYWWKVLMAERAIALYRRDPKEFRRQWQALRPGQRMEVAWYPERDKLVFHDLADLCRAYDEKTLVRPPADLYARGIALGNVAPLDAANAYRYKGLRPQSMGALLQLAALYRQQGGGEPLRVLSLTQTETYAALLKARFPEPPPKKPVAPEDIPIDMHPTGLCFDLQRPASAWNRKVLEYALGLLFDRGEIYWLIETGRGPSRYHVCPCPAHADALARTVPGWTARASQSAG
jgi:hypothetical protein